MYVTKVKQWVPGSPLPQEPEHEASPSQMSKFV